MDLKALILAKRKATAEEFQGRKFVKRSDLEAARLQKLRDEEEQERQQGKVCAPPVHATNSVTGWRGNAYCLVGQDTMVLSGLPLPRSSSCPGVIPLLELSHFRRLG